MKLSQTPEFVQLNEQYFIYVEKIGPFQETAAACWQELHQKINAEKFPCEVRGAMALFKMRPQMIYRAGFVVTGKPAQDLPVGVQAFLHDGGHYAKFTLVGPYSNLGPAWGQTMQNSEALKLPIRDDFLIENYANNPRTTPEESLISELMIPTKAT